MLEHSTPPSAEQKPPVREVSPQESTVLGIAFAWELGYTIAIPAIIFAVGGAYLDKYYGQSHWFLFLGIAFAFTVSFTSVAKKMRIILKRMPKDLPRKKKETVPPEVALEQSALHDLFRPPTE